VPFWFDRVAVVVLRCSGLGPALFPTAVGIAVSIVTHPEQWSSDRIYLAHPDIRNRWIEQARDSHDREPRTPRHIARPVPTWNYTIPEH
jgi:hypothetical protein